MQPPPEPKPPEPRLPQLTTEGGLRIRFHHEHGEPIIDRTREDPEGVTGYAPVAEWTQVIIRGGLEYQVPISRRTVCLITQKVPGTDEIDVVGEPGYAYCSPSDQYEAELGRQISLYQAMQSLPGILRGEIIHAYLHRAGAQPWRLDRQGHPGKTVRPYPRRRAA